MARGLALLGIGWANMSTAWLLHARPDAATATLPDQLTTIAAYMFAHTRGLPMFSLLLGFGIGLIYLSLQRKAYKEKSARRVLYRRYALLGVFGALHLVLLFEGDVMLAYAVMAMVLIPMTKWKDRTLVIVATVLFAVSAAGVIALIVAASATGAASVTGPEVPDLATTYAGYVLDNLGALAVTPLVMPVMTVMYLPLLILGFVAARQGVHRNPAAHIGVLLSAVALGIVVILAIGLPLGLAEVGLLPQEWAPALSSLNGVFGNLTGPAIAAAVLLACQPLQRRLIDDPTHRIAWPARLVTALGARSMSGYVAQSLLLVIITQPFAFNYGHQLGAAGQLGLIAVVWLATALGAWALEAAGQPGPLEKVHRRLAYGKSKG